ncbi:hypothetical protein GCM10022198_23290 [Klugiella xanthotipulae]|uniref:Uncharacterized protein n=1 Tax=Klugiella xanthotipulae TaxID=244735 RepID=A0A543I5U6_9MICO|nr:hypothetical protein [Klugiella xanthotipulae]TQM65944.1 hypothetical protein FB466_0764 [Klugiella xanthotipulae]
MTKRSRRNTSRQRSSILTSIAFTVAVVALAGGGNAANALWSITDGNAGYVGFGPSGQLGEGPSGSWTSPVSGITALTTAA